ncbi:MAG TPA: hypothetical protein VGI71_21645 [Scandinavium sp.]|jgi:hypothetical protein
MPKLVAGTLQAASYQADMEFCGMASDQLWLIEDRGGHIEELPEGAFKSSGTMVNTVVVVIPG